ncbi:MAG: alkaline phosphatase [Acidobacteria bacterium]|nr:alkaline phosphatase [Acidobacteriota bacterium]
MRHTRVIVALVAAGVVAGLPLSGAQAPRARNVVLFLADAGGIGTISAASLHGYGAPRQLFIQHMPQIALSDTTPFGGFVTDSSAGMTAIVTGQKTRNGVVAQSAAAQRKVRDGQPLKTILGYAEQYGLSTGIITNDAVTGATPASLYAHVNDRDMTAAIFQQLLAPGFGDGPDVVIGAGRPEIVKALTGVGLDLDVLGRRKGRPVLASAAEMGPTDSRALVVQETGDFDPWDVVARTLGILGRNPRGFFLMVEWDTHTDDVREGLDHMVALDRVIERTMRTVSEDTLVLFTADHSFDLRVAGEGSGGDLLAGLEEAEHKAREEKRSDIRTPSLRMNESHTGEEVLVAATGPGADRVRGYLANTDLFWIMMNAFGWDVR